MAYVITKQGDRTNGYVSSFQVNTRADVSTLPVSPVCRMGSDCIVLEDASVWLLNASGTGWQELGDNEVIEGDGSGGSWNTGDAVLGAKTFTSNGTYNASSDGYDGYNKVIIDVPTTSTSILGEKNITSNGTYIASTDSLDGYSSVVVEVPSSAQLQELTVSAKGTYLPEAGYDGFSKVIVQDSDVVLDFAQVGFKVHMGDLPTAPSAYPGKWVVADIYIDGQLYGGTNSASIRLEYSSDSVESFEVLSFNYTPYSSGPILTLNYKVKGNFNANGYGRKTQWESSFSFLMDVDPPISTIEQMNMALDQNRYALVVDL